MNHNRSKGVIILSLDPVSESSYGSDSNKKWNRKTSLPSYFTDFQRRILALELIFGLFPFQTSLCNHKNLNSACPVRGTWSTIAWLFSDFILWSWTLQICIPWRPRWMEWSMDAGMGVVHCTLRWPIYNQTGIRRVNEMWASNFWWKLWWNMGW